MKLLLVFALLAAVSAAPQRAKRGFGGPPCVVTGNSLYINGLYQRNLTSSEQSEMSQYQTSLTQYENALQAVIDQRREDRRNDANRGGSGRQNQTDMPEAPSRPSFCSDEAITQYIFDGCMVQDNKVYIGKQYARDLTSSEQQQLQDFDAQMTSYQNYLQQQLQNQVNNFFGPGFLSQFANGGSTTQPSTTGATASPGPAPQPPTTPNFCTAIY